MDSSADLCKQSGDTIDVSAAKSSNQTSKDSSNVNIQDKCSGGRRSSDSGPPPFNRNRSFKTKQLVRSQAINESQSPPRIPSSDVRSQFSGKTKSASVDLDDRFDSVSSRENFSPSVCEMTSKNIANNANSFKSSNMNTKNILVSASGDIKKLGANVIYSTDSLECKNDTVIDDKTIHASVKTKHSEDTISRNDQVHVTHGNMNNNDSFKCNKNIAPDNFKCKDDSSSVDLDCNRVIDYSNNNNDSKCYNLDVKEANADCRSVSLRPAQNTKSTKYIHNYKKGDEAIDCTESQPTAAPDADVPKNRRVSLKNLKNSSMNPTKPLQIISYQDGEAATCGNSAKVEFHPVEIQVTPGDNDSPPDFDNDDFYKSESEMSPHNKKEDDTNNKFKSRYPITEGRRAMHPSKQDSGVSCWDSSNCCGDVSPEIITSDTEDGGSQIKHHAGCPEHDNQQSDNSRLANRQSGMLTVDNTSSGGNQRLLRKQSSGGSMDSGAHSISSPFLSRDNSTEYMGPCEVVDVNEYVKEILNKTQKDRNLLLKLETEFTSFVKDCSRREHKFPAYSSYARLLVHRCAQLFGLRHGPDPVTRSLVHVAKLPHVGSYRLPSLCPLQQWCTTTFLPENSSTSIEEAPAKSILKRDTQSLDEEPSVIPTAPPKLVQTPRSKSFEQREEEYVKARRRIFNSPGQQGGADQPWIWDGTTYKENEADLYRPRILVQPDHGRSGRLLKVQSLEHDNTPVPNRGVVSKAHSFGGYGGRQSVQRGDSVTSMGGVLPQRILSRQGELASNSWRLSLCSSGYKTLSARSDSITPSPTSTPYVAANNVNKNALLPGDNVNPSNNNCVMGGVLWAITDMSTVPAGAIIIQPQSGQALTNNDGSLYHFDPGKPLHSALLPCTQTPTENIRVLSNPERRRSRLEKQRATISPGTESDNSSGETKLTNAAIPDRAKMAVVSDYSQKGKLLDSKNTNVQTPTINALSKIECAVNMNEEMPPPDMSKIHGNISLNPVYSNQGYLQNNYSSPEAFGYNNPKHGNFTEYMHKNMEAGQQHHNREDDCSRAFMNMNLSSNVTNDDAAIACNDLQNYPDIMQNNKQFEYYDQREMENKCIDQRQMDNYVVAPYSEIPNYYAQPNPSQYYVGPIYDESNQEMYAGHPQAAGYGMRPNESLLPTPPQQLAPQMIYAPHPDNAIGYPTGNELCYPACSAPVLIQQPHYRLQESDPQQPYHLLAPADQQQPVMVAISNKLHEPEMAPQMAGYPVTYPPHVERPAVISSSPAMVAAPHPAVGYQIQGSSGWSCWPPLALYAPHPQPPPDDVTPKYPPPHGSYIAQTPEVAPAVLNAATIPPTYFPQPNVIPSNQYYPSYPQAQIIQPSYPVYQPYNPGRTSVISQEGCSTPGFQTYDITNTQNVQFVQDNYPKNNIKSPKSANSRNTSNPGSSRATPLNSQMQNLTEFNYVNVDPNFTANYQFIQPPVNYVPYYPYHTGIENTYQTNCAEPQHTIPTKISENDNNNTKVKYNNKNTSPKTFVQTMTTTPEKKIASIPYRYDKDDNQMKQPPPQINTIVLQNVPDKNDKLSKPVDVENIPNVLEIDTSQKPPPIPISIAQTKRNPANSVALQNNKTDADVQLPVEKKNQFDDNQRDENKPYHTKNFQQKNAYTNPVHRNSFPSWNIRENDYQRTDNSYNHIQVSLMKQFNAVGTPPDVKPDVRMPWRRNPGFNQRDFNNFSRNHKPRFANDKFFPQNRNKDKLPNFNNANPRMKSEPLFDTPPIQITPTALNAPSVPWNLPGTGIGNICSNANTKNASPFIPSNQTSLLDRPTNESPLISAANNQHVYGKGRMSPLDVCMAAAAHQRYIDAVTIPIMPTSLYQRNPTFTNGGLGLMQTPPLQGQSTFLLRQVPGWLRRPPAPALFGPGPSVAGQGRGKPPRHQLHSRNFYH